MRRRRSGSHATASGREASALAELPRIHLPPRLYQALQDFVHRGHRPTFEIAAALLDLEPGETVVEIGCGTGILARHFTAAGYDYWGIDVDPARVREAERANPGVPFRVCDALELDSAGLPPFRSMFIHGLLHHLDEDRSVTLLDGLLARSPDAVLAVIEPFRPRAWWRGPLAWLFARLDEGAFVLTLEGWKRLFGPHLDVLSVRSQAPRWPVPFAVARLIAGRGRGIEVPLSDLAHAAATRPVARRSVVAGERASAPASPRVAS